MIIRASGGGTIVKPKLYTTASLSSIIQAEQQDRFLQLGELSQLTAFFSSGSRRLEVAELIAANADFLISEAAGKIFVGGSTISYLERPQAAFLDDEMIDKSLNTQSVSGSASTNFFESISSSLFDTRDSLPPGFKPISVLKYGPDRMKKSLRDLDWFLRYLTYAIVAGDTNILSVNIRGLRELIDNACSSAAAVVALREMRKACISLFNDNFDSQELVASYFNVLISEFESSKLGDKIYKRSFKDSQGLRLPQVYNKAGTSTQKFVMKSSLPSIEKQTVISACYRQIFQRDISKAYGLKFTDLESQLVVGQLSIKEFIRCLGKSSIYTNQFSQGFVDTRVVELSFRNFLGRGVSSLEEFQKHFNIIAKSGISGLIDVLVNSQEYSDYFGEETVPYLRSLGEEAQQSRNWGPQLRLFNYSSPFKKVPDFLTLFADYKSNLNDQHPYGLSNDPLAIQFGAIFTNNSVGLRTKSSFVTRDSRRILVRNGPGIYNQISNPSARSIKPYSLSTRIFSTKDKALDIDQIVSAIYIRVFGRFIYLEELSGIIKYEKQFKSKAINVRQFIRLLVKSTIFRSLYWDKVYICKSIEYLHIKLIGRPTYGRQEINKYFDIAYKQGYYNMVDAMLDSSEYLECFDGFIVPYERYIVPSAVSSRGIGLGIKLSSIDSNKLVNNIKIDIPERSPNLLSNKIEQGVSKERDQFKIFVLDDFSDVSCRLQVLRAAYRQVFERDINSFSIGKEFVDLENSFLKSEMDVKTLILKLCSSLLYRKEFYTPYPNIKVIELGTKHLLGRAPNNQSEIRYYNQILASKGLKTFISIILNSQEYNKVFGSNVVPYRRFPTLPAANFPNTQKLYNTLTKQNINVVVPSFTLKGDF